MSTTKPQALVNQDAGYRLADARSIIDCILNNNGASSTYGIVTAGTNAGTATQLGAVLNQIDTSTVGQGVALPLSTGRRATPNQSAIVVNNTANIITIYGFPGSVDTINGVAGTTGVSQPPNSTVVYSTAKGGAWFAAGAMTSFPASLSGTFTANGATPVTVANANITANSQVLVTLKTVGGTVGTSAPNVRTITVATGFTIAGIALDTSVYNYAIIG